MGQYKGKYNGYNELNDGDRSVLVVSLLVVGLIALAVIGAIFG